MAALSEQQVRSVANKYFGDLGPGVVDTMVKIAYRESGFQPGVRNLNPATRDDSHGLWQINVRPDANPQYASWNLADPEQNAKAARELWDYWQGYSGNGFSPWSTYNPATDIVYRGPGGDAEMAAGRSGAAPYTGLGGQAGFEQNRVYTGGGDPQEGEDGPNLDVITATINALANNMPTLGDFHDMPYDGQGGGGPAADQYETELNNWQTQLDTLIRVRKGLFETKAGIFRMEDGQIVTRAQMDSLDPASRAQVETYIANQNIAMENDYNAAMNEIGLTEFTTARSGVEAENTRRSTDFQNELSSIREQINLDMANQDTSIAKADRHLRGMSEASTRAATDLDARIKAAPWATSNGKTNFTAADLGMPEGIAGMAGFAPGADILRYTGTATIDPVATMNYFDQQAGVSGPIPEISDLDPKWAGMIPQAPGSIPIPQGGYQGTPMQRYQPTPMPTTTPPDLGAVAAQIAEMVKNVGGRRKPRAAPAYQSQGMGFPAMPQLPNVTDFVTNQFLYPRGR